MSSITVALKMRTLRAWCRVDAAEETLRGRNMAVQFREDFVDVVVDFDLFFAAGLQILEDRRVDHRGSAVACHLEMPVAVTLGLVGLEDDAKF